ncbi:PAS domain S-box protein [Spirosoma sp. HMF3257]|uniref:PAS domain S-box protein n=1 Tax=Spirosoma telluris TaxID=2183553 RepID=A0A327NM10_9BACT|nr:PAS domain S-box protein [Spirosoma telluris]RAI73638.1 hypothetical protein HMF3257_02930 [Spirosoma telluris]
MTNDKNLVKKQTTSARARKRKLRPVEKHLVTAFNQASVGLVIFQINGTVIHVNNACGNLTGYSPNELINNRFGLVIHPDDQTHYENHLYELTKGGSGSPVIQIRCIHKEGQQIWVKLHTTILEQESGQIQSLFSIVEEVTQEVILRDDQRKLLTLVDNSIELMSILEMDGKNSYINKAGLAMLGFDNAQQVQQTPISQLHAPEHFDLVEREVLPSVMSTGRWSGDMLVRHLKTGEIFPVFNNTIRIDDPYTGQPLAVGAVMRDRRPEVEAQRALEESELFARNVFHHSPVAKVVFVGQEMVVRTINEKMLALLGTDSTIIGKPFKKAMPALIATPLGQPLDQVFATGETYYQPEVRIPTGRSDQANLGIMIASTKRYTIPPVKHTG